MIRPESPNSCTNSLVLLMLPGTYVMHDGDMFPHTSSPFSLTNTRRRENMHVGNSSNERLQRSCVVRTISSRYDKNMACGTLPNSISVSSLFQNALGNVRPVFPPGGLTNTDPNQSRCSGLSKAV